MLYQINVYPAGAPRPLREAEADTYPIFTTSLSDARAALDDAITVTVEACNDDRKPATGLGEAREAVATLDAEEVEINGYELQVGDFMHTLTATDGGGVFKEWGIVCPACGEDDRLDVTATVSVRLTRDGTDTDESSDGSHEWDDDSPCTCTACGHGGKVAEFRFGEG